MFSGVQVVMVKNSAAYCNAVFFLLRLLNYNYCRPEDGQLGGNM
jgi:hypothetical protein